MHTFVLLSLAIILTVLIIVNLNLIRTGNYGQELGNTFGLSILYFFGVLIGFIGWILSILVLFKERHVRSKHSIFATVYIGLGAIGFCVVYYFIQAS